LQFTATDKELIAICGSKLKAQVGGLIRYPDASGIPSTPFRMAAVVHNPVVVFKVLGPGPDFAAVLAKSAGLLLGNFSSALRRPPAELR
jgi:hypothetical protein